MALLAGCSGLDRNIIVGSVPDTYRDRHPITIEERLATLDVPVAASSERLPDAMISTIGGFADAYLRTGSGGIAVVAPNGSANQLAAARMASEIEHALVAAGVPREQIDHRVYAVGPADTTAAVRIAYARIEAVAAPCGPWGDQLSSTRDNENYGSFGCATQANFAAMVESPLDLLYPRGMTPLSAERRIAVLDGYRRAEVYQSDYSRARQTDSRSLPVADAP